jgi:hypothetical protein
MSNLQPPEQFPFYLDGKPHQDGWVFTPKEDIPYWGVVRSYELGVYREKERQTALVRELSVHRAGHAKPKLRVEANLPKDDSKRPAVFLDGQVSFYGGEPIESSPPPIVLSVKGAPLEGGINAGFEAIIPYWGVLEKITFDIRRDGALATTLRSHNFGVKYRDNTILLSCGLNEMDPLPAVVHTYEMDLTIALAERWRIDWP